MTSLIPRLMFRLSQASFLQFHRSLSALQSRPSLHNARSPGNRLFSSSKDTEKKNIVPIAIPLKLGDEDLKKISLKPIGVKERMRFFHNFPLSAGVTNASRRKKAASRRRNFAGSAIVSLHINDTALIVKIFNCKSNEAIKMRIQQAEILPLVKQLTSIGFRRLPIVTENNRDTHYLKVRQGKDSTMKTTASVVLAVTSQWGYLTSPLFLTHLHNIILPPKRLLSLADQDPMKKIKLLPRSKKCEVELKEVLLEKTTRKRFAEYDYVVVGDASLKDGFGAACVIVFRLNSSDLTPIIYDFTLDQSIDSTIQDAEILPLTAVVKTLPVNSKILIMTDQKHFVTFYHDYFQGEANMTKTENYRVLCEVLRRRPNCHVVYVQSDDEHKLCDLRAAKLRRLQAHPDGGSVNDGWKESAMKRDFKNFDLPVNSKSPEMPNTYTPDDIGKK